MANNLFTGASDNTWGNSLNWSQLAVPTVSDGFVTRFDATSPSCLVDTTNRVCNALDFTGYTGTITMSRKITVSGAITLAATMNVSGSGILAINTTATITSNGFTWPTTFSLEGNTQTFTLGDDWTVNTLSTLLGINPIINGHSFFVKADFSILGLLSGTTNVNLTGTGIWSGNNTVKTNLTINTAGTITVSGTVEYGIGILTYTTGTVITTSSTLNVSDACTMNTNGISWNIITISASITLTSNLTVTGNVSINNSCAINGSGKIINIGGSLIVGTANLTGTAKVVMNGTGSITTNTTIDGPFIGIDLDINTSGTITFNPNVVNYKAGTMTYVTGTVVTTGNTICSGGSTTYNTTGITWNNFTNVNSNTHILSSNLNIAGTFTNSSGSCTINGNTMNLGGSATINGTDVKGTTTIVFNGTGTWSGNGLIRNNTTINTSGTLTISSAQYYDGTLTYTAGTVVNVGTTGLGAGVAVTLNVSGITWNNINLSGNITLQSDLNISGNLSGVAVGVTGVFNINIGGNLSHSADGGTMQATYIMTGTGIWSSPTFTANLIFNTSGTITFSGSLQFYTKTLTWIAGTIVTTGSSLTIGGGNSSSVFNCKGSSNIGASTVSSTGINFNDVFFSGGTITLSSPLCVVGAMIYSTGVGTMNGSIAYLNGDFTKSTFNSAGTTEIVLQGIGIWSGTGVVANNLTINNSARITIIGTIGYSTGTFTNNGTVIVNRFSLPSINITDSCSMNGVYKIRFATITVTAGIIITTDKFFTGTGRLPTRIQSTNANNYTVTITDYQCKVNYIGISNCTLTRSGSLVVITINGNKGGNVGVLFGNRRLKNFPGKQHDWKEANYDVYSYVKNWGQRWQGFVRNS